MKTLAAIELAFAAVPRPLEAGARLCVAFSGGLDSSVLLAALVRLGYGPRLRAVHIDHGLNEQSAAWAAHCARIARGFEVEYLQLKVDIGRRAGASLEADARDARYRALRSSMQSGDWLVTAHHGDDQLETLLHHLVRGAGVRGMRGVLDFEAFDPGFLFRPMLACTREDILRDAQDSALEWIEDPSNADQGFDRNFLRSEVAARLRARWPRAARAASRLAAGMRDAESILHDMALQDLAGFDDLSRLPRAALGRLGAPRLRNLLRHVARTLDLPMPSADALERIGRLCAPGANGVVAWPGGQARIYREHLYLFQPLPPIELPAGAVLGRDGLDLAAAGRLSLARGGQGGLPESWVSEGLRVGFRRGGERLARARNLRAQALNEFLREAAIVPWMRDRIPLLHRGGELVAIGDIWSAGPVAGDPGDSLWQIVWSDRPRLY